MSRLQEARDLLAATEGHTPAPWETGKYREDRKPKPGDDVRAFHGEGDVLCRYTEECCAYWRVLATQNSNFREEPGYAATGRLIAAAPALRDLLAAMVAEVERLQNDLVEMEKVKYHGWKAYWIARKEKAKATWEKNRQMEMIP